MKIQGSIIEQQRQALDLDQVVLGHWRTLIVEMTQARHVWATQAAPDSCAWTLDRTEGPDRTRARLVELDRPMPFVVPRGPAGRAPGGIVPPAAAGLWRADGGRLELAAKAQLPFLFEDVKEPGRPSRKDGHISTDERPKSHCQSTRITPFAQTTGDLFVTSHSVHFLVEHASPPVPASRRTARTVQKSGLWFGKLTGKPLAAGAAVGVKRNPLYSNVAHEGRIKLLNSSIKDIHKVVPPRHDDLTHYCSGAFCCATTRSRSF